MCVKVVGFFFFTKTTEFVVIYVTFLEGRWVSPSLCKIKVGDVVMTAARHIAMITTSIYTGPSPQSF